MRRSPTLTLEELPGDQYPTLEAAQHDALHPLACTLAATIQSLLSSGVLIQEGGRIVPSSKHARG